MHFKKLSCAGRLFFFGLTILFATILMAGVILPGLLDSLIIKTLRLERGNELWTEWQDVKVPVILKVYIFNITNHKEILEGAIPKIHEIGPYTYEEKRFKEVISENLEKGTVTYRSRILHYFRPDLSNGTEKDPITMVNLPLLGVANELANMPSMVKYMAKMYMEELNEPPIIHTDVGTLLFKGIKAPLIESMAGLMGVELLVNNTFAFFIERNRTMPDILEVDTGVHDYHTFGNIKSWNGQETMKLYPGATCNMINGTDGTIYAPFIKKEKILQVYEHEVCRSVDLFFVREETFADIPGYLFSPSKDLFTDRNPNNICFCLEPDKSDCPKSGMVSVAACRHGAPVFISNPHFLYADPSYAEPYGGIKPDPSKHESYLIVEPRTGIVLKGNRMAQANMELKPSKLVKAFSKLPDVTLPILWADEGATQQEHHLRRIRNEYIIPVTIAEYSKWILLALSCTMIAAGFCLFFMGPSKSSLSDQQEKEEKMQQTTEQEKFLCM